MMKTERKFTRIFAGSRSIPTAAISILRSFSGKTLPVAEPPARILPGDLVVSLISDPAALPLIEQGLTSLHNRPASSDSFHVFSAGDIRYILGSSPRGVMQGVHQWILMEKDGTDESCGGFSFPYRIFSLLMDGVFKPDYPREVIHACVRYLNAMGASHVAATNDFSGNWTKSFYSYVPSDIFPNSSNSEERSINCRILRDIIDSAGEFGLDVLFETIFMPASRDKEEMTRRFSEDVLSFVGPYQGWGLCSNHPKVRAFYREITEKFFQKFPEISMLHYITLDAGGDLCVPESCPRCRGMSKFDQHDSVSRFMAELSEKCRPRLKFVHSAFEWDRNNHGMGEMLVRQAVLPENIGLCMSASGDSATYDRQLHHFLIEARRTTWRAGQIFLGRDAFHFFDDSRITGKDLTIADYPLGMTPKIRRWNDLRADGFYDVRGRIVPDSLFLNSLMVREALLDPESAPEVSARKIASKFFGIAADSVMAAWRKVERAHRILSNGYSFPSASQTSQYFSWFQGYPAPLPAEERFSTIRTPDNELPPCAANGYIYHHGDYSARLQHTGQTMMQASSILKEAEELLKTLPPDEFSPTPVEARLFMGEGYVWVPEDYLSRNCAYLSFIAHCNAFAGAYFVLRGNFLAMGKNVDAYGRNNMDILKYYVKNLEFFASSLDDLVAAGFISGPLDGHLRKQIIEGKIAAVKEYFHGLAQFQKPEN